MLNSARIVEATWRAERVTVAGRAVLEELVRRGPLTVPALSQALDIKRQAVQRTVDELVEDDWVVVRPNPAHRRSHLLAPTDRGRRRFDQLHGEELGAIGTLVPSVSDEDLATAERVLAALQDELSSRARRS